MIRLRGESRSTPWLTGELVAGEVELPTPVHAYAAHGAAAPRIARAADDSPEIVCPGCGGHSPVDADRCRTCGTPFSIEGLHTRRSMHESHMGAVALALSLVGLACFPSLVISFLGVAFALGGVMSDNRRSRGRAIAGLVIGGLGLAAGVAFWWH